MGKIEKIIADIDSVLAQESQLLEELQTVVRQNGSELDEATLIWQAFHGSDT